MSFTLSVIVSALSLKDTRAVSTVSPIAPLAVCKALLVRFMVLSPSLNKNAQHNSRGHKPVEQDPGHQKNGIRSPFLEPVLVKSAPRDANFRAKHKALEHVNVFVRSQD
jgi:hypothetical protein